SGRVLRHRHPVRHRRGGRAQAAARLRVQRRAVPRRRQRARRVGTTVRAAAGVPVRGAPGPAGPSPRGGAEPAPARGPRPGRRPGDLVRVVVAAAVVAALAVYSQSPADFERDLVRDIADLPHGGRSAVLLGYQILAVWALALLLLGAILVRRWRLVRDLAVA